MKKIIIAVMALATSAGLALAQQPAGGQAQSTPRPRPTIGMGSKTMDSCRADIQKYCATASAYIQKECLVKNWDTISSDCQDALGTPSRGAGE